MSSSAYARGGYTYCFLPHYLTNPAQPHTTLYLFEEVSLNKVILRYFLVFVTSNWVLQSPKIQYEQHKKHAKQVAVLLSLLRVDARTSGQTPLGIALEEAVRPILVNMSRDTGINATAW